MRAHRQAQGKPKAFGESVRNTGLKPAGPGTAVATPLLASTKVFAKMGDLLDQTARKTVGVTGTFNVAALLGLQAGGADDRIAKASEETARNAKRLVGKANQGAKGDRLAP